MSLLLSLRAELLPNFPSSNIPYHHFFHNRLKSKSLFFSKNQSFDYICTSIFKSEKQRKMANFLVPLLFLVQTVVVVAKSRARVPAVIVFGDSSVDSGNNNFIPTIARSNFPPYGKDFPGGQATGRFCNGRIPPDMISEALGLKPTVPAYLDPMYNISDFAVGVCFASAGTGYDSATSDVADVIPLWKEVEYYKEYQKKLKAYLGDREAKKILSEALYLISLGTNDFLENYYTLPNRRLQFTIEQYQDFIIGLAADFVKTIYALGARKMSLTGVPPMGCLPLERTTNIMEDHACMEEYNDVALEYNGKLKGLVAKLNRELPGIDVVFADAYDILLQLIKHPSVYGYEEARTGCCGTGRFEMGFLCDPHSPFACQDANKYVFWDAFHPSEKTNQMITDHLLKTSLAKFL